MYAAELTPLKTNHIVHRERRELQKTIYRMGRINRIRKKPLIKGVYPGNPVHPVSLFFSVFSVTSVTKDFDFDF